jgi:hypothetical protein
VWVNAQKAVDVNSHISNLSYASSQIYVALNFASLLWTPEIALTLDALSPTARRNYDPVEHFTRQSFVATCRLADVLLAESATLHIQ